MTLTEFKEWIKHRETTYQYQLLGRMQADCLYFLGFGNGRSELWGVTIAEHIAFMQTRYSLIVEKPEWLTEDDIKQFQQRMLESQKVYNYRAKNIMGGICAEGRFTGLHQLENSIIDRGLGKGEKLRVEREHNGEWVFVINIVIPE